MTTPYAGQIAPVPRPARARVLRGLLIALVAAVFLACGLVVLAIIGSDTGVTGVLVGLALAAVPVFVVVPAFLWLDRFEAEPTALLLFAFGWGAAVATLIAILVNSTSIALLKASGGDVTVGAILVAPIVEETCKGAAVLLVFLYRRREFDGVVDGIVYAGMAGIGFAFTENVLYLGRALADSGVDGLAATFVLRCVFGPFAHPLFTMATGVGFGIAVTTAQAVRPLPRPDRRLAGRRAAARRLEPLRGRRSAGLRHGVRAASAADLPCGGGLRALGPPSRRTAHRPAPRGVRRDRLAHAGGGPDARLDAGPTARTKRQPASWAGPRRPGRCGTSRTRPASSRCSANA